MRVEEAPIPEHSLLAAFAKRDGYYTDCFAVARPLGADLQSYITAFYTQPLFQAERVVLRVTLGARSTDDQARALAAGTRDSFAAWTVQGRGADDILLVDQSGRTMSWLMVDEARLLFGSVVVPVPDKRGRPVLGPVFDSLIGVHKLYSRALLSGAARRLARVRVRAA